jgi:hypothetical protein
MKTALRYRNIFAAFLLFLTRNLVPTTTIKINKSNALVENEEGNQSCRIDAN